MGRLVATAALAATIAACSNDPMLASDLDLTTTTTTTIAASPTTTIMDVTTPTAVDPGPDVSDILRIAYDALLEYDSVSFATHTDVRAGAFGDNRSTVAGMWNRDGTSELRITVALDDRSVGVLQLAIDEDPVAVAEAVTTLTGGFTYRFPDDGRIWISAGGSTQWQGGQKDEVPSGLDLEAAADAALYLDSLFTAIVEATPDPSIDVDGNQTYELVLDADIIVPLIAPSSTASNLFDAGYDGVSDELIRGSITLDAEGTLIAAYVDQTPWWVAGWEAVGVGGILDDSTVEWSIGVRASTEQRTVEVPCRDTMTVFNDELGFELLECA